ncbi:TniB family NTP-binding protein [Dyella japonica]|uniref:AAA+ ATPase domain-containing protein n=1 Tax=Dyella japonica TaxID=231455 RepID=A0ABV2JQ02_9GAMM
MTKTTHLAPHIAPLLSLDPAERARRMLIERFISHERLAPIMDHISFLCLQPPQTRASGLVVSGKPGSGKTMLATTVRRRFPPQPATEKAPSTLPVLTISMTGAREAKTLYNRMLSALEVPDAMNYVGSDRERMVLKTCAAAGVKLLLVDEIQDILTSTARQQRIALDTIKFLMNELHIPIVALGTAEAPRAMQLDEHLNARFRYRELPVWKQDGYLVNFLDALEAILPLAKPSLLSSMPMMAAIIRLSGGVLDRIVKTICYAAAHAVETGDECITVTLLERADVEPPLAAVKAETVLDKAA